MRVTAKKLIEHINKYYNEDEIVVTTIYSYGDIMEWISDSDADTVWEEISDDFELTLEQVQGDLNDFLQELCEEYKDNKNEESV